ncbi:MAG: hypothetical protein ACK4GQ_06335 [Candidatus Hadarchaeales archaeon]
MDNTTLESDQIARVSPPTSVGQVGRVVEELELMIVCHSLANGWRDGVVVALDAIGAFCGGGLNPYRGLELLQRARARKPNAPKITVSKAGCKEARTQDRN